MPEPPLTLTELRAALEQGGIRTRYQPVVRLSDRAVVGMEALARLEHPRRGTLPPDLFVAAMEAGGLDGPLARAVIGSALAEWGGGRLGTAWLSVNMTLPVLLDGETLAWLERARAAAAIPAAQIVVELTETRELEALALLRRRVSALRALGYGLAIDDVGPLVRDHTPLLDMGFTLMKLDRDVVREVPDSPSAEAFVAVAIGQAKVHGLAVVAEGVEDQDIWSRMAALGVEMAQGYLVARPLPAPAMPAWQADWRRRHAG